MREACLASWSLTWARAEISDRQHVRVRPMAGIDVRRPARSRRELPVESLYPALGWVLRNTPAIPEVIGDSPHLSVIAHPLGVGKRYGAGRQAENDGPPCLPERLRNQANLALFVRTARDAIYFDE